MLCKTPPRSDWRSRACGRTITGMKQSNLGLDLTTKKTRKREFFEEMERVVPWAQLVALIEPHSPRAKTGRPPFPIETMLRIHFLQQWFGLSGRSSCPRSSR